MDNELIAKAESKIEGIVESKPKLSRLEREQEKIRVAQVNIDRILAVENSKNRKLETRDKILLGIILQGMIADGLIPSKLFEGGLEKYITADRDRDRCDAYFEKHSTWKPNLN